MPYPPRRTSDPPPFASQWSRVPSIRRSRLKNIIVGAAVFIGGLFLLVRLFGGSSGDSIPHGTPPVVVVTVLEPGLYTTSYLDDIKANRQEYAARHGYTTFLPLSTAYEIDTAPSSWAKLPALRHAMTLFPHSTYFWFLDQNSLIMNPELKIEDHIMDRKVMDSLMLRDQPIVPPDSVIKTFPQLHGEHIDFAVSQDKDGLAPGSFVLRRGEWSKFFLDTWFDPLYRSYNFQKAETHALEHIVQWHPTILSKLAIIPQRILNAYNKGEGSTAIYKDGDFVIRFAGCDSVSFKECESAAEPFSKQWKTIFHATR